MLSEIPVSAGVLLYLFTSQIISVGVPRGNNTYKTEVNYSREVVQLYYWRLSPVRFIFDPELDGYESPFTRNILRYKVSCPTFIIGPGHWGDKSNTDLDSDSV